jgi:hypothetical protein
VVFFIIEMKRKLSRILTFFVLGLLVLLFSMRWILVEKTKSKFVFKADWAQHVLLLGDSHPACSIVDDGSFVHMAKSGEAWYYATIKGKVILENNPQINCVVIELNPGQLSPKMKDWINDAEHVERAMKSYYPWLSIAEQWQMLSNNPIVFGQKFFLVQKQMMFGQEGVTGQEYFKKMEWGGHEVNAKNCTDSLRVKKWNEKNSGLEPVAENVSALRSFVSFCQERNVKVVFISCPVHHSVNPSLRYSLRNWKQENFPEVPYLDFTEENLDDQFFLDREHLNETGAKLFTPAFIRQLNAILTENVK